MTEKTGGRGRPAGSKDSKPRIDAGKSKVEQTMTAAERAREAARLRTMRVSWDTIAQRLGYSSRGSAYNAVQREIRRIPREAVNELRNIELESLDRMEQAAISQALAGNLGAIDRVLRIKELRGKYTGVFEGVADSGIDEVKGVLTAWRKQVIADDEQDDEEHEGDAA